MTDAIFYVYALLHPVTLEPFYIGKGSGNRVRHHLDGTDKHNFDKVAIISAARKAGQKIGYHIWADELTELDAYAFETALIKHYGMLKNGGILTNRYSILRGCRKGTKWTEEQKLNAKLNYSDERKKKISVANRGRKASSETCLKLSMAARGRVGNLGFRHAELTKSKWIGRLRGHAGKPHSEQSKKKMGEAKSKVYKLFDGNNMWITDHLSKFSNSRGLVYTGLHKAICNKTVYRGWTGERLGWLSEYTEDWAVGCQKVFFSS